MLKLKVAGLGSTLGRHDFHKLEKQDAEEKYPLFVLQGVKYIIYNLTEALWSPPMDLG